MTPHTTPPESEPPGGLPGRASPDEPLAEAADRLIPALERVPAEALRDPGVPPTLRAATLAATLRVVRYRGVRRRTLVVAALAVAFGAGWASSRLATPTRPQGDASPPSSGSSSASPTSPEQPALPTPPAQPRPAPVTVEEVVDGAIPPPSRAETTLPSDPRAIEEAARHADDASRYRLLKEAGDRYLGLHADVESALRCYRRAIGALEPTRPLRAEPGDSWLFTALVTSRT